MPYGYVTAKFSARMCVLCVYAPDFVDALGNLQDKTFDFIVNPYDDTASLDASQMGLTLCCS